MAGARPQKKGIGDAGVRRRLLASATDLFNRKGYAGTTVREIVAAAGVTKPVLYYYFRNKEGIYLDLMGEAWAEFDALLAAATGEAGSAASRIRGLADRTLALFVRHIGVARLMYSIYYGPQQGAPHFDFDAYHIRFQKAIVGMVEGGIRRGEFRTGNAEDMAWALIGAINVTMELHLCHPERVLGQQGLERVLDVIFAGMTGGARGGRRAELRVRDRMRKGGAR